MRITVDDLTHPRVHALLHVHLERMHEQSPPGSVFALGLDGLRRPDVTFWVAWDDDAPGGPHVMGCGALKELDPVHGEVKSMRTADTYLRRGVAAAILDVVVRTATERGYRRLSLETGSTPAFEASHALYRRHGFVECGPFAGYTDSSFSRYFTLDLAHAAE
jgi:putative acetyltransferase